MKKTTTFMVFATALAFAQLADAAALYGLVDLGTLGGEVSRGLAINNAGQVSGYSTLDSNLFNYHAFLYSGGTMHDLGGLGGSSDAFALNNSGNVVVVGESWTDVARTTTGAFIYTNGALTPLPNYGNSRTGAYGINDDGVIVGAFENTGGGAMAFKYDNGTMTPLGVLGTGDRSTARAINDSGDIVGSSKTLAGEFAPEHAFLIKNGTMQDLQTLGGTNSSAVAINDAGLVAGSSQISNGQQRAFLYVPGTGMVNLGSLNGLGTYSSALGLNLQGQVVGESYYEGNGSEERHAFIYTGGTLFDLNSLIDPSQHIELLSAGDINDSGQIVALGYNSQTLQTHAYLLTPVPLPAAVWLLLSGLGGLGAAARRRRLDA